MGAALSLLAILGIMVPENEIDFRLIYTDNVCICSVIIDDKVQDVKGLSPECQKLCEEVR